MKSFAIVGSGSKGKSVQARSLRFSQAPWKSLTSSYLVRECLPEARRADGITLSDKRTQNNSLRRYSPQHLIDTIHPTQFVTNYYIYNTRFFLTACLLFLKFAKYRPFAVCHVPISSGRVGGSPTWDSDRQCLSNSNLRHFWDKFFPYIWRQPRENSKLILLKIFRFFLFFLYNRKVCHVRSQSVCQHESGH